MDKDELKTLKTLDNIVTSDSLNKAVTEIVFHARNKLIQNSETLLAWEPIPLTLYNQRLPDMIRSSWVFIIRARAITGAERHPNSHQRMVSFRGSGDVQIRKNGKWHSNYLNSDTSTPIESRWASIPVNTWHQAAANEEHWTVISFHTVPEDELIEERPDKTNPELIHRRKYLG